jgi:hypothetical protein
MKTKGSSNFPSTDTWPWCPISNKKMKKGEQAPSLPNLGNDVLEVIKKNKRGGA